MPKKFQGGRFSSNVRYNTGVAWIALNDEPTITDEREVSELISVTLLAAIFGLPEIKVAQDVLEVRRAENA